MLEKVLFGFMAFVISFFVFLGVTFKLAYSLLSTPTTALNDDMESMRVYDQCALWAFFVALFVGTLMAWLAARFSVRLSRSRPPESFRKVSKPLL